MKAFLYITTVLMIVLNSCKEAEELKYDHTANIYFNLSSSNRDSIVYTFAYEPTLPRDTVNIAVSISGIRENRTREYKAYIERDSSTAQEGVHFEKLKESYTIEADSGRANLPLIIYNTADLEEKALSVIIKLQATNDLGTEVPNLLRAKVVFSATLEKPNWWNMWLGSYYSRVKHQLFLVVTNQTMLTTDGLDAPKNLYFTNMLTTMLNDPFTWVDGNPEKGYVLEAVAAGSMDSYYFYNEGNPNKKILLRKNMATGRYYFIDENGEEVN